MRVWIRYCFGYAIVVLIASPVLVLFAIRSIGLGMIKATDWMAVDRCWSNWLFDRAEIVETWATRK